MSLRKTQIASVLVASMVIVFGMATSVVSQEKVVHVWHTESAEVTMAVMDEIIADFEKLHPEVEVKQLGLHFFDQLPKIQAALAAGSPPEVAQWITGGFYEQGVLRSLDDVVETIGDDLLYEGILKKIGYRDGHWYGIPHAVGTSMLVYRKDLADEKGVVMPDTWDEWIEFTGKLVEDVDGDGITDRWGYVNRGAAGAIAFDFALWVASNGGHMYAPKTGDPVFTDERVVETLEFYGNRNKNMNPAWLATDYTEAMVQLATGRVAQFMGYGRGISFIEQYASPEIADSDHFAAALKPHGPQGEVGIANQDGEAWIILKDSENPELGAEFLKFFYKPENYIKYCFAFPIHLLPISRGVSEHPEYLANPVIQKWKGWLAVQEKQMAMGYACFGPQFLSQWYESEFPWVGDIGGTTIVADAVSDVLIEGKTPQEAMARAQGRAEQFIKAGGYKRSS